MPISILRPYQEDCVGAVRLALQKGYRAPLLRLPTGGGKTVIACAIMKGAITRGFRSLFLAHRDTLIKQCSRKLAENQVHHGIIMAGITPDHQAPVQVGSVQTMIRRIQKFKYHFDIIFIDEAHLSAAKTYMDIAAAFPNAKIIGITGTPGRLDDKGLGVESGCIYDYLINDMVTTKDLIEQGYLVQPDAYAPEMKFNLDEIHITRGEYDEKELGAVMDRPTITGDAIEHYRELCPGVPALAWCINVQHAQHTADQFNAAGIPAAMVYGDTESGERDRVLQALADRRLHVVSFCQLLVEGIDVPAIGALILLRPTRSLVSYLQVGGRALRRDPLDPDKKRAVILDHAGLTWTHRLIESDREWSLAGTPKKTKDSAPGIPLIQCLECGKVFEPAPVCPRCGTPVPKPTPREIEVVDGKLGKVTEEMISSSKNDRKWRIRRAKTLEDVQALGAEFGYSPKWALLTWGFKEESRKRREEEISASMKGYEMFPEAQR